MNGQPPAASTESAFGLTAAPQEITGFDVMIHGSRVHVMFDVPGGFAIEYVTTKEMLRDLAIAAERIGVICR